jgi:hypothetical protein
MKRSIGTDMGENNKKIFKEMKYIKEIIFDRSI